MVVVATWNLENLYRPESEFGPKSEAVYHTKLSGLASTITASGADVLGVQEVGDPDALADLAEVIGGPWHLGLSTAPDARGIRVGYLSKLELEDVVEIVDLPDALSGGRVDDSGAVLARMGRGGLQVTVQTGGRSVTLINCHLKSKLLTYPNGRFAPRDEDERARFGVYALNRRAAEAGAVRIHANAVLDNQGQDRSVIVLGDLNDGIDAATTQTLLGPGGSEIGSAGERRPDSGDGSRLWNLAPLIPEERRYSRIYRGRRELIDHLVISRALLEHITRVDSSVTTAGPALRDVTDTPVTNPTTASDHALVAATLAL